MLTFNLKKEWFKKIKSGEKTHEYREVKPYWDKRLKVYLSDDYSRYLPTVFFVRFLCGYPTEQEIIKGNTKVCTGKIKSIRIINGLLTDLKINKDVYDIEFELIKDLGEMKSEQEIKEKLNTYKKIKDNAPVFTREFTLACGAITALEWVLSEKVRI